MRCRKEAAFMWAIWNKDVAINSWRAKVDDSIIQTYPLSQCKVKTAIHRFWDCSHTQCAWEYT